MTAARRNGRSGYAVARAGALVKRRKLSTEYAMRCARAVACCAALVLFGAPGISGAQEAPADSAGGHEVLGPAPEVDSAAAISAATGDNATIETLTRALASELRCPVCQGLSIQDSPTELSQQMKDVIREQLRAGKSPDEVKAYFVARYGEWILLQPEPAGFNLLVYIVPWGVFAIGALVLVRLVRRWTKADEVSEVLHNTTLD